MSLFLQALKGENKKVPVWFMRQAGRFLPQYRKIREKYSLAEMFQNPEIAAEVTCQPVDILGVDAAILFADILTLPSAMGFEVEFAPSGGPVVRNPVKSLNDLKKIHSLEGLEYLTKAIQLIKKKLPEKIPLIGFAGSPFTVACYLTEGTSSSFAKTFELMHKEPAAFKALMEALTKNTVDYLNLQKKAGIQVYQIFDSWIGVLRPADYANFVVPYLKRIFEGVKLPSIYYLRGAPHLLSLADHHLNADFLSVCHEVVLGHNPTLEKTKKGVQGNLFNGLFYADKKVLEKEVNDVLLGAKHYKKYIFNTGHGLTPDTDVDKVKFTIDLVHRFSWK